MKEHEELRSTVVSAQHFRCVLGRFASGVVVLSAMTPEGPVGMSCQSFFSVSLEPPLIAVSPSLTSRSWPRLRSAGCFGVSMLSVGQEAICRAFAVSGADKFAGVSWTPGVLTGAPLIAQAHAWLECVIETVSECGDHYLVVARVLDLKGGEGVPLVFYQSKFTSLAI